MTPAQPNQVRILIERLSRLSDSEDWNSDLNPAQMQALRYLASANRFSRAPSHVAAFSGATRGTVSQTLRALERKGLVTEARSQTDRRSISYAVTAAGRALAHSARIIDQALAELAPEQVEVLEQGLAAVLRSVIAARGGKTFGLCHQCCHHQRRGDAAYCRVLEVDLEPAEKNQICHEHEPA
ncbi:MarR family winged helix-turn-helix transcriptional regulator [Hoeflea sp. Naph1]|uniref:MarR family winged helix-turn-helix transcriptional regulator n=1 Tax=Hoeflea sp. Naph1 TaxID=3388653 RepID=UPI00398FC4B5